MREKLQRFMEGRYGSDQLSRFLLMAGLICLVLNMIFSWGIVYYIALFALFWNLFRVFSRSYEKRYAENLKYLELRDRFVGFWSDIPFPWKKGHGSNKEDANYHIFRCPSCRQKVRVPKGKGKISITCPRCHTQFIRKS